MNDNLYCDICLTDIIDYKNDLWHFTGVFSGKKDGHIHLCSKCVEKIKPPMFDFDSNLSVSYESLMEKVDELQG